MWRYIKKKKGRKDNRKKCIYIEERENKMHEWILEETG